MFDALEETNPLDLKEDHIWYDNSPIIEMFEHLWQYDINIIDKNLLASKETT